MNKSRGFTLLEILLVVGIIAILAGIVTVAVNPTKQFAAVRNTQRKANLSELNKALYQYYIDNSRYPTSLTTTLTEICDTEATSTGHSLNCTNKIDLSPLVPTYLVAIPTDPQASGTSTGYLVAKNTANKVYLKADNAELSQTTTIGDTSGVLPDHLVSYWSFDGNANDSWGGNNGSLYGDTVLTTGIKSLPNTAYSFDGTGDYISTTANVSGYSFTLAVWFKTNQTGSCSDGIIIGGSTGQVSLYFLNNKVLLYEAGSNYRYSSSTFCDNQWHFVTAVYRYGAVSSNIYIDGVANESGGTSSSETPSNVPAVFYIGRGGRTYFNGVIDNVRIYNKALSSDEVMNIYNFERP